MKLEYRATPPTLGSGNNNCSPQSDNNGNLKQTLQTLLEGEDQTNHLIGVLPKPIAAATYSPVRFADYGANATLNVKTTTGNVLSVSCFNANGATRYLQLHNTATVPNAGDVPRLVFLVPSLQQIRVGTEFFTQAGVNFSTGIAFAFSTTQGTYTAGVAGDQFTQVLYV